ncbi:toxin-antitoxin system YwqK family antitoxin [Stigmatella aurantiaca]|uniref:toxin-antitoxin system YwqK family antitoxin n=1 Tax=Stigmatella aurantiaca TaxID=41 RepID=UPI000943B13B|nr:hypothetical protein [Stigmatella aurantiaca]
MLQTDDAGRKTASEFWLNGQCVGKAEWDADGTPQMAMGLRGGRITGHRIDYHRNGVVSYAEPFLNGLLHGWAKQYSLRGRLLLASPFQRGTGIDYWCDNRGRLAEEHPLVGGKLSGCDRWWDENQQTVYRETGWLDGEAHGIHREWTEGRLRRGFPQFFIRGQRVSKREYLAASRGDSRLPAYTPQEDLPERTLPERFLQLRQRVRRKVRR